jgi:CheY-like chemotaxis protein
MSRVLVVDDEPDVLLLCRLNLQQRGHELLEAADGSTALEIARELHPDVIVLDLMLPGISGYDVLEALQRDAETTDIPVLVLTAKSLRADRERSHGLGASAFLTKPFLPHELCEMVDSLVAPRHGA